MKTLCAFLFLFAMAATPAAAKTPGEVEVGGQLREAQLQGLGGPSRKLSEYRGKPLIINVWASWCGPCRAEMGSLERLHKRYGGSRFNVIGISTDDYIDKAEAARKASGVSFRNYIDSQLLMENMLGANKIPLTLLIDEQGRVAAKLYGAMEWDTPEAVQLIALYLHIKL